MTAPATLRPGRLLRKLDPAADTGRPPAPFVVGASRSGTTLLRLMLDAHPDLAIPPETHFVQRLVRKQRRWPDPAAGFVASLVDGDEWPEFGLDPEALRRRVAALEPFDLGNALRVFYALYAEQFGKTRWGDKTPGYLNQMTTIQSLLPEARFVHLIRDGRDVGLSVAALPFGPKDLTDAPAWWAERIGNARAQAPDLHAYLEVRYEDLVTEPEPTLRNIAAFLDLPWTDAMLDYHRHAGERFGASAGDDHAAPPSIHVRTTAPPDRQRIGRWQREMDDATAAHFEQVAGGLLDDLGYPLRRPVGSGR